MQIFDILDIQLNHHEIVNRPHTMDLRIMAGNMDLPDNIGGLFRLSDAFGVGEVYFTDREFKLTAKMRRVSRSTEKYIKFRIWEDPLKEICELKKQGFGIIALEYTKLSLPLYQYNFSNFSRLLLVLGNERFGLDRELLNACDASVHIPMHGENSSMNVVQAAGICLYECCRQHAVL